MLNNTLKINFFPILDNEFNFQIYKVPCIDVSISKKSFQFPVDRFNLPAEKEMPYRPFFVAFEQHDTFIPYTASSKDNNDLTVNYLYQILLNICNDKRLNVAIPTGKFFKSVDFIINETQLGKEAISITPTYNNFKFGFILNYHFIKDRNIPLSKEVLIKSLSLNKFGGANSDYYSGKYEKINIFIESQWTNIFLPMSEKINIKISKEMDDFRQQRLEAKKYVFANDSHATTQFKGILNFGPYINHPGNPLLCFVFRNNDRELSQELYRALNGTKYPTFLGMDKMFKFPMNKSSVMGIGVDDYSENEILKLINDIKLQSNGREVLPIILAPWTKDSATQKDSETYYFMKYQFLKNNMPSQFVGIKRVTNYESLKWSVASIGLQIFTKLGGSPWCLDAKTDSCLIIGIGQAHKKDENDNIEKYFSYSIMSESTGLFKNIKILSDNTNHSQYLNGMAVRLKELIESQLNNYQHFILHTSFKLRRDEMKIINDVIKGLSSTTGKNFAVLRFSGNHKYMGFNLASNTLTPYESTYVRLSKREYLVWFEGLPSFTNTIKQGTRIGPPMHIHIDFPNILDDNTIVPYLQDAINLSGANWRGFNAKTTPISILYAHLLSEFVSAFDRYKLEKINVENIKPWFL
jgi:hypothetical protein